LQRHFGNAAMTRLFDVRHQKRHRPVSCRAI
jgi:hypothetical protein